MPNPFIPRIPRPPFNTQDPIIQNIGLAGSFDKTNLDIENVLPYGGIPYNVSRDPTQYPSTTTHTSAITGYFATGASGSAKFSQPYSPTRTYLDFIRDNT